MLKKNDTYTLDITSITNLGFGVGRVDGQVVFVQGAVTGDIARVKIIKVSSSFAVGRIEEIIKKSEHRTDGRCPLSTCSVCTYKSVLYSHECEIKENDVREAFVKAGLSEVEIAPLIPSPALTEYRNKAQYPITKIKSGQYSVGFYAPKSHRVCEARKCPLAPTVFSEIIDVLTAFFKRHELSVYDEESGKGLLRHIYLRRGEISGEILLTLVISEDTLPYSDELVAELTTAFPALVGILININKKNTNVILGERFRALYGRDYIFDTLGGNKLKITAPSFYQVNHDAAEILYAKAKELCKLKSDDVLLDLYCGAGSIGLSMAKNVKEIIGIEIIESAVECAIENAKNNGIANAHFYTGDAKNTELLLENAERSLGRKISPTVIVLDPPRAGCDEKLIEFVASKNPERIVYISCNPTTLARDAAAFKKLGYDCGEVTPVDLFPMTGHVESVVCLTRRLDIDMRR